VGEERGRRQGGWEWGERPAAAGLVGGWAARVSIKIRCPYIPVNGLRSKFVFLKGFLFCKKARTNLAHVLDGWR
jgi:hypothetical protein